MLRTATLLLALCLCAAAVAAPPIEVTSLGTPVRSARLMATGLAKRPDGGHTFIGQYWNYRGKIAPEWVLLHVETGETRIVKGDGKALGGGYAIAPDYTHQVQAGDGRIFFSTTPGNFVHYDPATDQLGETGPLLDSKKGYKCFYRVTLGPDGRIYAATQSNNRHAALAVVDPTTMKVQTFEGLGTDERKAGLTYGYWMAVDPPWVYLCVGQGEWELVAVNTETGETRSLNRVTGKGEIISFNNRPEGLRATVRTNFEGTPPADERAGKQNGDIVYAGNALYFTKTKVKNEYFWLHEGSAIPALLLKHNASNLPFRPINERWREQYADVASAPKPTIDIDLAKSFPDGNSLCTLLWRPKGETGDWREDTYTIGCTEPISLESLLALSDGTLLGSAQQYNGFFRYDPRDGKTVHYGKHGPSRPALAEMGGTVYICGYPNTHLYGFDPAEPWTSTGKPTADTNPRVLGAFSETADTHYAYFLIPAESGRLYFGGRRERRATGGGLGWYDPKDGNFHGVHENLAHLTPRGMAVLEEENRIVFSGEIKRGEAHEGDAELVVYDLDLKELARMPVKPGLRNTGSLRPGPRPGQVIGWIDGPDAHAIYLFDITARKLLLWKDADTSLGGLFRRPDDDGWWLQQKGVLARLDPNDLSITVVGTLDRYLSRPQWIGDMLYGTSGPELLRAGPVPAGK